MKTSDLVDTEDLLHFFIEHKVVWKLLLERLHLLLCSCLSHSDLSHPDEYFRQTGAETKIRRKEGTTQCKIQLQALRQAENKLQTQKSKPKCTQRGVEFLSASNVLPLSVGY